MLDLLGVPVAPDDVHRIIASLLAKRSLQARKTAGVLWRALRLDLRLPALTATDRHEILSVLEDQADGLGELRGLLARGHG